MQIENLLSSKAAMLGLAVLAFLAAAILVLVIVRMLFGGKLRMPGGRARQARLGIVDAFDLDRQRQLIIVRRDNTEHLIMIGGPNDLLIESEIVRVEARDFRRDKGPEGSFGDARIPAPFTSPERPEKASGQPSPADEPMLPIPLPEVATVAAPPTEPPAAEPATPPRAPTFPLPPRRPAPAGERRQPAPPRLPEVAQRDEGAPPVDAPAVAPPSRAPMPSPIDGASATPPASPTPGVAPTPPVARPIPPFIKPLSPRPPLRPLQRTTPRPLTPPGAAPADPAAKSTAEPAPKPVVPAQARAAEPPETSFTPPQPPLQDPTPPASPPETPASPVAPTVPATPAATEDDLSLEEEMAKLLGRG